MVITEGENTPDASSTAAEQSDELKYGPINLSEGMKDLLQCESLSEQNPMQFIPVDILTKDIQDKNEASDFYSYKDFISTCSENIMLVFDGTKKYGTDYFICLSEDAKLEVLDAIAAAEETDTSVKQQKDVIAEDVYETTSDEVNAEMVFDIFPKIKIVLMPAEGFQARPLQLFSRLPSEYKELYTEILPETEYYKEPVEEQDFLEEPLEPVVKKILDKSVQASVSKEDNLSQTLRSKLANACSQTELKEFTDLEKDELWKSEEMALFLPEVENRLLGILLENASGGLGKPWAAIKGKEAELASAMDASLKITKTFLCCGEGQHKMVTSIDWHPVLSDVLLIAAAHSMEFEEQVDSLSHFLLEPCYLYMWGIYDSLSPRLLLDSCDEISCVQFNPFSPRLIAAGGKNGQLILWDLRKHEADIQPKTHFSIASTNEACLNDCEALFFKSSAVQYCASSFIDSSHLMGINCLHWIPAGLEIEPKGVLKETHNHLSYQIVTCGSDGCLRFWDIRQKTDDIFETFHPSSPYETLDLCWKPFHVVEIISDPGQKYMSITSFYLKLSRQKMDQFEEEMVQAPDKDAAGTKSDEVKFSTCFIAGTEDGRVLMGDFCTDKIDTTKLVVPITPMYYTSVYGDHVHGGKIISVNYSPFLSDIFYSIGNKMAVIWKEDIPSESLFMDISEHSIITAGHWSVTRPAVLILGLQDGSLRIWDLLRSSRSPQLLQTVSSAAITEIKSYSNTDDKHAITIGDANGYIHVLDLPKYLWKPIDNEVLLFRAFLDRAAKRAEFQVKQQAEIAAKKIAKEKEVKKEEKEIQKEPVEEVLMEEMMTEQEELLAKYKEEYNSFLKIKLSYLTQLGYDKSDEELLQCEQDSEEEEEQQEDEGT